MRNPDARRGPSLAREGASLGSQPVTVRAFVLGLAGLLSAFLGATAFFVQLQRATSERVLSAYLDSTSRQLDELSRRLEVAEKSSESAASETRAGLSAMAATAASARAMAIMDGAALALALAQAMDRAQIVMTVDGVALWMFSVRTRLSDDIQAVISSESNVPTKVRALRLLSEVTAAYRAANTSIDRADALVKALLAGRSEPKSANEREIVDEMRALLAANDARREVVKARLEVIDKLVASIR